MLYLFHSWTFYYDMYFEIYSTRSQFITSSEQLGAHNYGNEQNHHL